MTEAAVSFAGNLTDDPELRHTETGIARAVVEVVAEETAHSCKWLADRSGASPGPHDGRKQLDAVLAGDLGAQRSSRVSMSTSSPRTAPTRSRNGRRLRTVRAT